PPADGLVFSGERLVPLECIERAIGRSQIQVEHYTEIAMRRSVVRLCCDRALVRARGIAKFAEHPQGDTQLVPAGSTCGIALHGGGERLFRLFQSAGLAVQKAEVDERSGELRIAHGELLEFELRFRGV